MTSTSTMKPKMPSPLTNGHDAQKNEPQFAAHSIYLKDLSFEAPHLPEIYQEEWKPKIDFDLQMASKPISEAEGLYEVVLLITVTAKVGEDKAEKPAFLIEVQQAGAFTIKNLPQDAIKEILATTCPTILFPYGREAISNLVAKGGFPQLVLPPINFDAMYAQHLSEQGDNAGSSSGGVLAGKTGDKGIIT